MDCLKGIIYFMIIVPVSSVTLIDSSCIVPIHSSIPISLTCIQSKEGKQLVEVAEKPATQEETVEHGVIFQMYLCIYAF